MNARDYAYKLLAYRQRSVQELTQRLQKKGFSAREITKTVAYLSEFDYLNDEKFARVWVQTMMQSAPVGRRLLHYQLRQKGIAEEIVEKVLGEMLKSYDEFAQAKALAATRKRRYRDLKPAKIKNRLYNYLRRRGFSQQAVVQAIGQ